MEIDFQQFKNQIFISFQYGSIIVSNLKIQQKASKKIKCGYSLEQLFFYGELVFFASMGKLTKNSRLKKRLPLQIHQNQFLSV